MIISNSSPLLPVRRTLARGRSLFLDLLFPPRCGGCGARGIWLCAACLAQIAPLVDPLCERCGRPLVTTPTQAFCRSCRAGELRALDWARAAYPFAGPLRETIHRFKYGQERARAAHLAPLLWPLLAGLPTTVADRKPRVIPVPLAAARRRERGYNQAEELARVLADERGLQLDHQLVRARATRPQVGLARPARHQNVREAFRWQGAPLRGEPCLLIDDVLTTGATADECAATLKAAGAGWVGLLTVARATERPGSGAG
jgi:ComF family protein